VGDDAAAVAGNRALVAREVGLGAPEQWVWLHQVHGATVHVATGPTGPTGTDVPDADAAVTAVPGLPLAVITADCAPIALACADAVGVVHAGHPGLEQDVIEAAVTALREIGTGPVRAYLGPCIRPARYEFGAAHLERFATKFGPSVVGTTDAGRPALDVPAAVHLSLRAAGVDAIDDAGVCTSQSPVHFSYRRDGITGRQATIVVLV
jgi:hypothetical protein